MKKFLLLCLILSHTARAQTNDNLPINKIQVIGSHNSYKKAIDPALFIVSIKKILYRPAKLTMNIFL